MEIREMRKKNEMSNAYIINMQPYEKAVSKIDINVDKITPQVVNYAQILISTDSNFSKITQTIYITTIFKKGGIVSCVIPQPPKNCYYKFYLSLNSRATQNGSIQISKIAYYTSDSTPHISGSTSFLDSTSVTLSSENQDAKIYYTTDGTEPTDHSTAYTAPFSLKSSTNVKAVAYVNGERSKVISQNFKKVEENELISVAQALKTDNGTQVYIKAKIAKTNTYNSSCPTLNYYIADAENAAETLRILNGRYLQNTKISNAFQIVRGDEVVLAATVDTNNDAKVLKNVQLLSISECIDQAKISTARWATFVDFSNTSNLSAYTVKYDTTANQVTLSPVTAIPGNTAVVVKGNAGTYDLQQGDPGTTITDNDLKFGDTDTKVPTAFSIYVLAQHGDGCSFYPVKAGETLAPFKGNLTLPAASSAKPYYAISNTTTDISNGVVEAKNTDGVRYNLVGQRVNNNYQDLIIVNGHKVILK